MKKEQPSQQQIDDAARILSRDAITIGELKRAVRYKPFVLAGLSILHSMELSFYGIASYWGGRPTPPTGVKTLAQIKMEEAEKYYRDPHRIVREQAEETLRLAGLSVEKIV